MDVSTMKNMVVLKNLPSNIVDEAFLILKSNKKVKKFEKIESIKNKSEEKGKEDDKGYVLKEAEMLIEDYILKIEENKKQSNKRYSQSSKKFKRWALVSTVVATIEGIILFMI